MQTRWYPRLEKGAQRINKRVEQGFIYRFSGQGTQVEKSGDNKNIFRLMEKLLSAGGQIQEGRVKHWRNDKFKIWKVCEVFVLHENEILITATKHSDTRGFREWVSIDGPNTEFI